MQNATQNVLVVGAGPVGLTMAAELARHGVSCRIIDQLATPTIYCRAIGVTPRTLEVWDDMGIAQTMIDAGLWLRGRRTILNGGTPVDSITDFSDLPYGSLGLPQPETERVLREHLAGFGLSVERPVTLTALRQVEAGVEVDLLHADHTTESTTFRYVVGCDGSRSTVRRQLGIAFEGDHFAQGFMLGDVVIDYDVPRGISLWAVTPRPGGAPDFIAAIPLPERKRFRITMLGPNEDVNAESGPEHGLQAERPGPTLEELQGAAERLIPSIQLADMRWSSHFRIGMRLAAHYREGSAFLAGDAAHIHPPLGGQGMNTGIQDAYNLAWKMALVVSGKASATLLDSYDAERRAVGADVVARTVSASAQFGRKQATREDRLADTQILVNYRGSAVCREALSDAHQDLPIHAGDRAPDCRGLRRENIRAPFRLFDVTRGAEHVLAFYIGAAITAQQVELLENLAQTLKSDKTMPCRLLAICAPECERVDLVGVPVAWDKDGEFAAAYAPDINTGYVIRPDGYVGYHARPLTTEGLLNYFASLAA